MGMSSYIMDQEEQFFGKAADIVSESESIEEAVGNVIKFAKDNWMVPHLTEKDIEYQTREFWSEYWSKYND